MTFYTWKGLGLFNNVFRLWEQRKIRTPFIIVCHNGACALLSNDGSIRLGRGTEEEMTTASIMLALYLDAQKFP